MVDAPKILSSVSERLRRMAARIDHNAETSTFGGAVVIIPPDQGGDPIEILILDSQGDSAQFWGTVTHRVKAAIDQLDEVRKQGFGVRR